MSRNDQVVLSCVATVVAMLSLGFLSAPLYDLFCRVTGFGGTTQVAHTAPQAVAGRTIEVRFDANVAPGLGWHFRPEVRSMRAQIGENRLAFYTARNADSAPSVGVATYNVTPHKAGPYVAKLQCFCFERQPLAPGEEMEFAVSLFVDPAILDDPNLADVTAITLSYTFFPATDVSPQELAAAAGHTATN